MNYGRFAVVVLLLVSLPLLCFSPSIMAQGVFTSSTFNYTGQFPFQGGPGCGVFVDYFAAIQGRSVHIVFSSDVMTNVYIASSSQYSEYNANATSHPCPPVGASRIGTNVTRLSYDFLPPSTDLYYVWLGYQPQRIGMPNFSIAYDEIARSITMSTTLPPSSTAGMTTATAVAPNPTVVASTVTAQPNQALLLGILAVVLIIVLIAATLLLKRKKTKQPRRRRRRRAKAR